MSKAMIHADKDISLHQLIESLQALKDLNSKHKNIFDTAINLIGRCLGCKGTGQEENITKPDTNYKIKISPRGTRIYVTQCNDCQGSGKQLDVICRSCGESAAIRPEQIHLAYCHKCESRLRLTGILI